jgi:hypothetical protein
MRTKLLLLFLGAGLILASCTKYPPDSDRLLDDLVVYTNFDVKANFTDFKTYYMSDSIVKVDNKDSGWYYNSSVQSLTSTIAKNLNNLGYTRTYNVKNADLNIGVSFVENVNVNVYYPGWYWGYYPPDYWYGGYYPYYPYYPAYVTTYTTGSLMIDMFDMKDAQSNQVPVCWNAYIRGLMTGTHTDSEVTESVNQAFKQTKAFQGL